MLCASVRPLEEEEEEDAAMRADGPKGGRKEWSHMLRRQVTGGIEENQGTKRRERLLTDPEESVEEATVLYTEVQKPKVM